jgi:hypothetical protein
MDSNANAYRIAPRFWHQTHSNGCTSSFGLGELKGALDTSFPSLLTQGLELLYDFHSIFLHTSNDRELIPSWNPLGSFPGSSPPGHAPGPKSPPTDTSSIH